MLQTNIIWKGVGVESLELLQFAPDTEIKAHGNIIGIEESIPYHVTYQVITDDSWHVKSLSINVSTNHTKHFFFEKKEGQWLDERGKLLTQFAGCIDVDISLTPFTNALPVNRLRLKQGEQKNIHVLYCKLPEGKISSMEQRYTNLGNNLYLYESVGRGYSNVLMVDENGIPVHYPGRWDRLKV